MCHPHSGTGYWLLEHLQPGPAKVAQHLRKQHGGSNAWAGETWMLEEEEDTKGVEPGKEGFWGCFAEEE